MTAEKVRTRSLRSLPRGVDTAPAIPAEPGAPAAPAVDPAAGHHFTVVPHTHWDREWYLPFEVFRIRLARTVEEICDVLEADPRFTRFTLDGQSVILEDVVDLRPDLEPRLRALIADGRLATGPSYVLPDEFLAGPESLVRNLLVGRAVCERFGARPMSIGYMPDPFGHVSQLPQILRGFGIDAFVFWRGLGDEATRLGLAFRWEAPDGTAVTAIRQLGSYGNACQIGRWAAGGVDMADQPDRYPSVASARFGRYVTTFVTELDRTFGPRLEQIGAREVFLCNGADHERIQAALPDLLEHARREHPDTGIEIGSYEDYWRRLAPTLATDALDAIRGELVAGRDAPVLRGINSSRIWLKQAAERTERAILVAETLASLASLRGAAYPRAELARAWREHIRNLPHDSVSGCSVDEVHRDMAARSAAAQHIAERVRREALAALAGREEVWSYRPARAARVSAVNPLAHARRGLVAIALPAELEQAEHLVATAGDGELLPVQVAPARHDGAPREAFVAIDLDGFGARDVLLAAGEGYPVDGAAGLVGEATIGNGLVTVTAHPDATVTVRDECTGRTFTGLHRFEDVADRGDEYNFCPVEFDLPRPAEPTGEVRVTAAGPAFAELEVALVLRLPERLSADRRSRVGAVDVPVTTRVRVSARSGRVEFTTTVDNRAEDHRLRVRFAAPGADETATIRAEGHFDVVRRPVRPAWAGAGWTEPPALTAHTTGAVASGELLVLGRGLPEYEAVPTHGGADLALTLLRCVGWLSRDDLATRPGGAGPTLPTPEAQCPGRHTFQYAVELGDPPSDIELLRRSTDYRTPLTVGPAGVALDGLLRVGGDVLVTAVKGAEDGDGVIVRAVAPAGARIALHAPGPTLRVRLDETPETGDPLEALRPGEIRTLRLARH